jgi:NADH dehydrogenase
VEEATADGVRLSSGEFVPTRSLIWCVGVRPDPLVEGLGLATDHGRLVVDEYLNVPGRPDVARTRSGSLRLDVAAGSAAVITLDR